MEGESGRMSEGVHTCSIKKYTINHQPNSINQNASPYSKVVYPCPIPMYSLSVRGRRREKRERRGGEERGTYLVSSASLIVTTITTQVKLTLPIENKSMVSPLWYGCWYLKVSATNQKQI